MTYPDRLNLTITLDSVDVTAYVVPGTLSITSILTSQADTAQFTLENAGALTVNDWDEVIITDGAIRIFAGFVLMTDKTQEQGVQVDLSVSCVDYTILLDKVKVKEEYLDKTDKEILIDLMSDHLSEITTATYVKELRHYDRIRFNRMSLREIVDQLADIANADWYIDYHKRLHFFSVEENSAPFELSDSPDLSTSYPFNGLTVSVDGTQVINRVEVVGGMYLSDDNTFYLAGTGQDNRITLPLKAHAPDGETSILVWRNDGTEAVPSWTSLTVKAGYIDQLGGTSEVLHYFQEKVLEQQNNWPNLPNAVKVEAKYEVPLRARVRSEESYNHYGRWFDEVVSDTNILDKATARLVGKGILAKNAMATTALSLSTYQPGIRSGETLTINSTKHGVADDYLVQRVVTRVGVNGQSVCDIEAGTYDPDLVDMMVKIARDVKKRPVWNEDEVLDEFLETVETMALTETSKTVSDDQPPYTWGTGGSNDFEWDYATWS